MYKAVVIAENIIEYCENQGWNITNLRLQKLLYYVQGIYICETGKPLYEEKIEAWRYGPVIPEVYYYFNEWMNSPISNVVARERLCSYEEKILNDVVDQLNRYSTWELVTKTHNEEPWQQNYVEGLNRIIPISEIEVYFREIFYR